MEGEDGSRRTTWAGLEDTLHCTNVSGTVGRINFVGVSSFGVKHPDVVLLVEIDAVDGNAQGCLQDIRVGAVCATAGRVGEGLAPGGGISFGRGLNSSATKSRVVNRTGIEAGASDEMSEGDRSVPSVGKIL